MKIFIYPPKINIFFILTINPIIVFYYSNDAVLEDRILFVTFCSLCIHILSKKDVIVNCGFLNKINIGRIDHSKIALKIIH